MNIVRLSLMIAVAAIALGTVARAHATPGTMAVQIGTNASGPLTIGMCDLPHRDSTPADRV
jgi:hypothetical protein